MALNTVAKKANLDGIRGVIDAAYNDPQILSNVNTYNAPGPHDPPREDNFLIPLDSDVNWIVKNQQYVIIEGANTDPSRVCP